MWNLLGDVLRVIVAHLSMTQVLPPEYNGCGMSLDAIARIGGRFFFAYYDYCSNCWRDDSLDKIVPDEWWPLPKAGTGIELYHTPIISRKERKRRNRRWNK